MGDCLTLQAEYSDYRQLRAFSGESDVSYDWLWRGTPRDDADLESFSYPFVR